MDRTSEQVTVQTTMAGPFHEHLFPYLEGLLFAAGTEGLTDRQIARVFDVSLEDVEPICLHLLAEQKAQGRMFEVRRVADAWQLITLSELSPYLRSLALAPPPSALSQAALETLAIIAYKQPITRLDIESIRGVKSERAIGTLVSRGLICEAGRAQGPGRPFLYQTTHDVLDHFGLASMDELRRLFEQFLNQE